MAEANGENPIEKDINKLKSFASFIKKELDGLKALAVDMIDKIKVIEANQEKLPPRVDAAIVDIETKLSTIGEQQQTTGEAMEKLLKRMNDADATRKWKFSGIEGNDVYFIPARTYDPERPFIRIPKEHVKFIITKTGSVGVKKAHKCTDDEDIPPDLIEAIESITGTSILMHDTPLKEQLGITEPSAGTKTAPVSQKKAVAEPLDAQEYVRQRPLTPGEGLIVAWFEKNKEIKKSEAITKLRSKVPKGEDIKKILFILKTKGMIKNIEEEGIEYLKITSSED